MDAHETAKDPASAGPRVDMAAFERRRGAYVYTGLRRADIQILRGFRNAQIAVLRQKAPLTQEQQTRWYDEVVTPTHLHPSPAFLLVSILDEQRRFLGYGGLTNIDWEHRRAEVSFLVDPARAASPTRYREDFSSFLAFLQDWAFDELGLNRLFTETYAFRRDHMSILEAAGLQREGVLRQHIVDPTHTGAFVDSILHGICASDRR